MTNRMLIDTTQPEETRVVVLKNDRVDEVDFDSADRKQLKGSIYLAKITRVEPSLQAAFIDFGGNRHGFLPFSEIHPDYYRIPVDDRKTLIEDVRALSKKAAEKTSSVRQHKRAEESEILNESEDFIPFEEIDSSEDVENESSENSAPSEKDSDTQSPSTDEETVTVSDVPIVESDVPVVEEEQIETSEKDSTDQSSDVSSENSDVSAENPDSIQDIETEFASLSGELRLKAILERKYKIQEVITRGQVILIQVVKEERGNKGAALTSYLSLAGRYCVFMPNAQKQGGVSRKITDVQDRKRLKGILETIDLPENTAIIVRTAGSDRTKAEIKRDYDYLQRTWDEIREKTLQSTAPTLVHEEGSIIKRAIRDVYTREMEEILVEGNEGYKVAKTFMKTLTPSHARKVKIYKDKTASLFRQYRIDEQLDELFQTTAPLPSGGYLVLNQTEALVAIDVNSGKSTHERNIEDTALKTNLEAADEVARQLRLRDLAGLVVIDFIDMGASKHNQMVERRLKEAMKRDRARIQIGHISSFGLLELSRQRLRPSLVEVSYISCASCKGTGMVRATNSMALMVLRSIEEQIASDPNHKIKVSLGSEVLQYILNEKHAHLKELETSTEQSITWEIDPALGSASFKINGQLRGEGQKTNRRRKKARKSTQNSELTPSTQDNNSSEEENKGRRENNRRRKGRRRPTEKETGQPNDENRETPSSSEEENKGKRENNRRRRNRSRRIPIKNRNSSDQQQSNTNESPVTETQGDSSQTSAGQTSEKNSDGTPKNTEKKNSQSRRVRRPRNNRTNTNTDRADRASHDTNSSEKPVSSDKNQEAQKDNKRENQRGNQRNNQRANAHTNTSEKAAQTKPSESSNEEKPAKFSSPRKTRRPSSSKTQNSEPSKAPEKGQEKEPTSSSQRKTQNPSKSEASPSTPQTTTPQNTKPQDTKSESTTPSPRRRRGWWNRANG